MLKGLQQGNEPELLSGPVPGESLTNEPGAQPWERASEVSDPEEAIRGLTDKLMTQPHLNEILGLMDAGVDIESLAQVLAFGGFVSGKWTPDVAEMIKPALIVELVNMAHKAGINDVRVVKNPMEKGDGNVEIRKALKPESLLPDDEPELPFDDTEVEGGFMGME